MWKSYIEFTLTSKLNCNVIKLIFISTRKKWRHEIFDSIDKKTWHQKIELHLKFRCHHKITWQINITWLLWHHKMKLCIHSKSLTFGTSIWILRIINFENSFLRMAKQSRVFYRNKAECYAKEILTWRQMYNRDCPLCPKIQWPWCSQLPLKSNGNCTSCFQKWILKSKLVQ